jgi:hypothetical protein
MESHKIPAANTDDVDLSSIMKASPSDAAEMLHIGSLIASGAESDQDLIRLCELLFKYGHVEKSEELLRSNIVDVGDQIHDAYVRLHGLAAHGVLDGAIADFARQFGVRLELKSKRGFLKVEYSSQPDKLADGIDPKAATFLKHPCSVLFIYDPQGCLADVASRGSGLSQDYLLLRRSAGKWGVSG